MAKNTAQGMFDSMRGSTTPSGTNTTINTVFGGQDAGSAPIGTFLGGQSSGSGAGVGGLVKIGDKMSNGGTSKALSGIASQAGITSAGQKTLAGLFGFYGGETVSQIKSICKVKISGGPSGLKTSEDKGFYSNVCIPKKKV